MSKLTTYTPKIDLMPANANKDTAHRVNKFTAWLNEAGRDWTNPDLAIYRDELLKDYAPSTVSAHLSTVRAQYGRLLRDNATRDTLFGIAATQTDNGVERKAIVDEMITRLTNAIDPKNSAVKTITKQDIADSAHLRLTKEQAEDLMTAPGVDTLHRLRDTAILVLMLCTGIREAELCALDVVDLRQELGGELALHIRDGKGAKERLVPYGELDWCLVIVDFWLDQAEINSGAVFRGIYKGGKTLRSGGISVRAVEYIVSSYPVVIRGRAVSVCPHDLRRTYARRLYEAGTDLIAIQQNLGHADVKTTLGYIGALDIDRRRPPAVYSFNLDRLNLKR